MRVDPEYRSDDTTGEPGPWETPTAVCIFLNCQRPENLQARENKR